MVPSAAAPGPWLPLLVAAPPSPMLSPPAVAAASAFSLADMKRPPPPRWRLLACLCRDSCRYGCVHEDVQAGTKHPADSRGIRCNSSAAAESCWRFMTTQQEPTWRVRSSLFSRSALALCSRRFIMRSYCRAFTYTYQTEDAQLQPCIRLLPARQGAVWNASGQAHPATLSSSSCSGGATRGATPGLGDPPPV